MGRPTMHQPDPELDERLAALLISSREGDLHAFEAFYEATIRLVLPAVRRICGEAHAEDALADAYFQAWTTIHTFDAARGSALAWIRMIASSRGRDRMRTERHCHGGLDGALPHDPDQQSDGTCGPEEILQSVQACARLQAAVSTLPRAERMLIGLAYYRDRTQQQIAQETGMGLGSVKNLMRDSHARLHAILAPRSRARTRP
ncbi:MAG: RNA polymerase sigma factor [Burkholderiales bacterium]